jgi:TonB family protein
MLLIYQIKVGICLIAFYLLWKLLLSRETFHRFNRVALLTVMALAFVLPWVKLSLDVSTPVAGGMVVLEEMIVTPAGTVQPHQVAQTWNVINIANLLYFIGVVSVLVWLLHSQWSLHRLLKKGRREQMPNGITLHVVPGDQTPFSYFRHIVINEQDYRDNPREILTHEHAHISLRHSWDVLFVELVKLFQWWNPAAWLLCRELRQVHEYEADMAVLNQGVDAKQYQLLLIRKSVGDQLFSMANNFNYQSLKKRIRMMTMNKSSRWKTLRALAVVPVIALALLAFANTKSVAAVVVNQEAKVTPASQVVKANAEAQVTDESAPQSKKVYRSVDQMPQFPGGEAGLMRYLQSNINYPANAAMNNIGGRVILQFVVEKDGHIGEVKVVRSIDPEIDAEAVRVVKSLPDFIPGRQDGEPVAVWYTIPVSFKVQSEPQPQPQDGE